MRGKPDGKVFPELLFIFSCISGFSRTEVRSPGGGGLPQNHYPYQYGIHVGFPGCIFLLAVQKRDVYISKCCWLLCCYVYIYIENMLFIEVSYIIGL